MRFFTVTALLDRFVHSQKTTADFLEITPKTVFNIQKKYEFAKCKLLFLPTYSPDLNLIEKFWEDETMDKK
jgi:hypothetical protein